MVLYDLTSSYFEGVTCPLAAIGHPHDGRKGMLQVNYGLLTDDRGCPVAISVFEGNTNDSKTLMPQVIKMKERFGIQTMVLVRDRGMITQKLIDEHLKELEGVEWITALRSGTIRKLVNDRNIQMGLFDERNLFEINHPYYPGERLVACRNPELVKRRGKKRRALLDATVHLLKQEQSVVERGKLRGREKILARAGKIVKERNVAAHFVFDVHDDAFAFHLNDKQAAAQAALDGACRKLNSIRSLVKRGKLTGNAPDLVPRNARADLSACPETMGLLANVTNIGAIGVPPGVPVAFFWMDTDPATLIGVDLTTRTLLPGASELVRVDWTPLPSEARGVPVTIEIRVDDDGMGNGVSNECDETNNTTVITPLCSDII